MRGLSGGARGSLWDSDLVGGVAFQPRKCARTTGKSGWVDSTVDLPDGTKLAYRLYKPSTPRAPPSDEEKACVLVYFHANAELCSDIEGEIDRFYACGYCAVVCPEFRGYGWSTGKPRLKQLGPDAEEVMKELPMILKNNGVVEDMANAAVVVHGRSLGTVCAIHVASRFAVGGDEDDPSKLVNGLIVESGVVALIDLPMVRQLGAMMPDVFQMLAAEPEPLGSLEKLRQISIPTVIIHGDRDEVSPVSQAVAAHKACGSTAKKLKRYPRAHHNDLRMVAGEDYYRELTTLRRIAAGEAGEEDLTDESASSVGFFGSVFSALRCVPGMRRCLAGDVSR